MTRKPSTRGLRIHRSYTVDEAARALGLCKATLRRWIKTGLPAIQEQRPTLILGRDLIAFIKARTPARRKLKQGEFFCLSCRSPRRAAFGEVEVASRSGSSMNVRALCEQCATVMHRRFSLKAIDESGALPGLCLSQADRSLSKRAQPCPIVHSAQSEDDHDEASPEKRTHQASLFRLP